MSYIETAIASARAKSFQPVPGLPLFVRAFRTEDGIAWGETRRPTLDFTISADGVPHSVPCYRSKFYNSDLPKCWDQRNADEKLASAILYAALCDAAGVKEGRRAISADERYIHAAAFIS